LLVDTAAEDDVAHSDVIADAAYLAAICGDEQRSGVLEHRLHLATSRGPNQVGTPHHWAVVRVTRFIAEGRFEEANAETPRLLDQSSDDLDGPARSLYLTALASSLVGNSDAADDIEAAFAAADRQHAWRWDYRIRLLDAVSRRDRLALSQWLSECGTLSRLAILETADLLGASLDLMDPIPEALSNSLTQHRARWRPVLLRQLAKGPDPNSLAAARLLTEFGSRDDAPKLAAFERRLTGSGRKPRLSRALVRRVSPTLRIHDLGRTTYEVSGLQAPASSARRKALGLVLFVVTRPKQVTTKESLMEGLWPDQTPEAAINSLHQTLHFVRREIAPWSEDGIVADYVPLDSELIYLDPELVQVDSVAFMRQASEALASPNLLRMGPAIASLYTGRFAPEFEYEDWAEGWRTLLHAQFLLLSQASSTALLEAHRTQHAIEVLSRAIEIDGLAFDLRGMLVRALARAGASDAASDHYRHYSSLLRRELDERTPSLEEFLRDGGGSEVQ
jgi:DNA-binding SARP family transcriptional activator